MQSHHTGRYAAVVILLLLLAGGWYLYLNMNATASNKQTTQVLNSEKPPVSTGTLSSVTLNQSVASKDTVDITGCTIFPRSITTKLGSRLTFVNRDSIAHIVSFSPQISYGIAAKQKKDISFNFVTLPGTHKYSCDGKLGAGSIIFTNK